MPQKRKIKTSKPDETYQLGPLLLARFGNTVVIQNTMSSEEFNEFLRKSAAEYPNVCKEIDVLVSEIRELVSNFEPLTLLQCGFFNFASSSLGKKSEAQYGPDDVVYLRMLDYIQSVIVSTTLNYDGTDKFDQDQWNNLKDKVEELYRLINLTFHMVHTAHQRLNDPNYDPELDDFKVQAQMLWTSVRGKRYLIHDLPHLRDILTPHDDIVRDLFGISIDLLLKGLESIQTSLTEGLPKVVQELREFQEKSLNVLSAKLAEDTTKEQLPQLMKDVIKEQGWEDWQTSIFERFLGFELFNVGSLTGWPSKLLDELAYAPGEDNEFFEEGTFAGWPLRVLPIQKRPFLKFEGNYYCFDLISLTDNIYRVLQRLILRLQPEYQPTWNERQKVISEKLPFDLFTRILPNATILQNIYHQWQTGKARQKNWCETDGLIIYDDHLLIIEVKAGAFTYTSPTTDFEAYINSIKDLVLKPAVQANRFVDYLKSEDEVAIFDDKHNEIGKIRYKDFRHITACCVTLDGFTTMATQEQSLKILEDHSEDFPVWSVSIDDLRVYADLFDTPINFLHFLEERQRAFNVPALNRTDEINHLALYLTYNKYVDLVRDYGESNPIGWHGYHEEIDAYFYDLMVAPDSSKKPGQKLPTTFKQLLEILTAQYKPGHCKVGCYLLNFAGDTRAALCKHVDEVYDLQRQRKRILPFSLFGEAKLTVFCIQDDIKIPERTWMHNYVLAALHRAKEHQRLMLVIRYDSNRRIVDIDFTFLSSEDISDNKLTEIKSLSEQYAKSRIASYLRQTNKSKVGRNELCPCGSGKKYKSCCGSVIET